MARSVAKPIGLIATLVLAGCTAGGGQAVTTASACPANHTPACEVSPGDGTVIASSCRCVRTSDVNRLLRQAGLGHGRTFRRSRH